MVKWKFPNIGKLLKNSIVAVVRGQFLLKLNIGRYMAHIIWLFVLIVALIWFNLKVDATLSEVERNKVELRDLEIEHEHKTFELRSLNRRSVVKERLQEMGSDLKEPDKPVTILEK